MGKRRKTKAIRGEFYLPEPIIHRIQSFLTGKEAAQTAILSRPWYSAWLSRPNLEFDEGDFYFNPKSSDDASDSGHSVEFLKLVEMTIQRYEQSNLKIERLRLRLRRRTNSFSDDSNPASHLIVRALKIGATHIRFRAEDPFSALPVGVFESGNLVELSVKSCNIDPEMDRNVIICPKLESLSLSDLLVKSEIIYKIISSFPLIKKLSFSGSTDFRKTKGSIGFPKLHELRCLVLSHVKFDNFVNIPFNPQKRAFSGKSFSCNPGEGICGLHKRRQVENVTMNFSHQLSSFSGCPLFDFLSKFITHKLHPENTNNDLLWKTLVRGMNGEFSSPSSFMHGLHDLEEANMELYDEDVAAWRPLPLESLLDGSITTPKVVLSMKNRDE